MSTTEDFKETGELAKELGLTEALTIGVGTMIGAGIFVLPRYAIELAGPGAILSYILAGLICMITASSTAELATGMPKSGGAYFFISRSMGSFMGTVSGVSVWLSLTFAVAFYLQGFGEYLSLMLPFNETLLAILAGIFFTYVNYVGAKETGKTQNIIVGILLVILTGYTIWGGFHFESSILKPFLPQGSQPILPVTAMIFISFLGFVQIASVAEEIKNPSYTMPRALIGSVVIATIIYALVLLVTTGVLPYQELIGFEAPIVEAARVFSGVVGVVAITFAALLATASSANASILAASRISFALGRDRILPEWLNEIHSKFLTPYRPILLTGALTLVLIITADVEALSSSASVLMLLNYALINITVIVMRLAPPEGYEATYKSPGYPYLHIIGAITSFIVIFMAGNFAKIIAVGLLAFSLIWFFVWARSRSKIKAAASNIEWSKIFKRKEIDSKGPVATDPELSPNDNSDMMPDDNLDIIEEEAYRVLAPMANPNHETTMLKISAGLVKSSLAEGEIDILNVLEIPKQSPLDLVKYKKKILPKRQLIQKKMLEIAVEFGEKEEVIINPKILYSHDKFKTIYNVVKKDNVDFLLLGWRGSFNIAKIYNSLVKNLIRRAPCNVGVLRDKGLEKTDNILIPYRGSEHAYSGVKIAQRLAANSSNQGKVTVLRVVKPGVNREEEKEKALAEIDGIIVDDVEVEVKVVHSERVVDGIVIESHQNDYDLIVMGASQEWRFKNILFGSIPDIVAEEVATSVLMVRCYEQQTFKEAEAKILVEDSPKEVEPVKY